VATDTEIKILLLDYLSTQQLLSLGTSDGGKNLWAATVYFVHDENCNLYFMSAADTRHMQNVQRNDYVSCTVTSSEQSPDGEKVGVQSAGTVSRVTEIEQLQELVKIWNQKFSKKPAPPLMYIKDNSPFYKISPTQLKLFHTGLDLPDNKYEMEFE